MGTENLVLLLNEVAGIIEDGYNQFKDGVQIWDLGFIPKGLKHVVVIAKIFPEALKEIKDLDMSEIAEVLGYLVTNILSTFDKYKSTSK